MIPKQRPPDLGLGPRAASIHPPTVDAGSCLGLVPPSGLSESSLGGGSAERTYGKLPEHQSAPQMSPPSLWVRVWLWESREGSGEAWPPAWQVISGLCSWCHLSSHVPGLHGPLRWWGFAGNTGMWPFLMRLHGGDEGTQP